MVFANALPERFDVLMLALNRRRFFREGPDVQDLRAAAFGKCF